MARMIRVTGRTFIAFVLAGGLSAPLAEPYGPDEKSALADKVVRHPGLTIVVGLQPVRGLSGETEHRVRRDLAALGLEETSAFFDPRAGRLTSFVLSKPLLPGTGVGNAIAGAWPADDDAGRAAVWNAIRAFIADRGSLLQVDPSELGAPSVGIQERGTLIQVHVPRVLGGIPVRNSGLTAVVNHGNLVLLGLENWGDARVATPALGETEARLRVVDHLKPLEIEAIQASRLEYVPLAAGEGYDFRLVWAVRTSVVGDLGTWEGLVDAATGELIAFEDRNHYGSRRVMGGVHPVSDDGRLPDGVEQPDWPMPFSTMLMGPGLILTTTSAGTLGCQVGTGSTLLSGPFARINDACGFAFENASGLDDFDFGFGPFPTSTNCFVPAGHSAGGTKSARTAFYELNRVQEQARAYLPGNAWLQAPLVANTNISQSCNAFWDGITVNFYRQGGACGNTGQIAGIIDHEWAHGLDNNGLNSNISSPSEGIADIHATLRLADSCIGRGTVRTAVCSGYGDTCVGTAANGCTAFRDADFARHTSGQPHDITWIRSGANGGSGCSGIGSGPCGSGTHCQGQPVSEVGWDLHARDLRVAPFNFDSNTALERATRLFYLGAETVTSWFTCGAGCESAGTCGCEATNGYLLLLAADDDNGNLADGTPHMQAIHAAFDRHQMACTTPVVTNSGCAGGPTGAPTVTATAGIDSVGLAWTAVAGASRYSVYRTEGGAGCDFGKVEVGDVTTTSFDDTGLLSGREYSYVVLPVGSNPSCLGRASACASATPAALDCETAPNFTLSCDPSSLTVGPGSSTTSECTVQSVNAFASAVAFSCTGLAAGLTCAFNPAVVTPAPDGTATGILTLTVGPAVVAGSYIFQVHGAGDGLRYLSEIFVTVPAEAVAPFALAVDSAGNGVLQPNETIVVAPAWRNTGANTIAIGGSTSAFTGPAGPVYSNPDDSAAYGTIGVAATGTCTTTGDCYTVDVTATSRPAAHWDATITETVFLPTMAVPTDWTLHVGDSFTDVPSSNGFYRFVETILHANVTGGCGAATYCPSSSTTREQMAVFVLVSKEPAGFVPPPCGATPMFSDVPAASPFCRWIEELARRGVVSGCASGQYCPSSPATREQMAVFVLRTLDPALDPPACAAPVFGDVPASSPFCRWIEELARRGVVTGCGGGNYCPTANVSREQMAVFLAATFGLTLYGI